MLGWGWYGLHKKIADTRYVKLVLLYLVGSMGHVVHSGASRAQNVDALFIVLGQDRYRFYKKCVRTRYAEHVFLHLVGLAGHVMHSGAFGPWTSTHYFSYSGGTGTDSTKSALGDTLRRTYVFASRGAFRCVRGTKCRRSIFHGRVGWVRFP
jgi:hypothetical protein